MYGISLPGVIDAHTSMSSSSERQKECLNLTPIYPRTRTQTLSLSLSMQTQPVPNPFSPLLHSTPSVVHKVETLSNHIIELVIPWLMFFSRDSRLVCGCVQIFFQVVLIISGNLSFLNWLTIAPAIMYMDDRAWAWLFFKKRRNKAAEAQSHFDVLVERAHRWELSPSQSIVIWARRGISIALLFLLAKLSIPVVQNLLSPHQVNDIALYNQFSRVIVIFPLLSPLLSLPLRQ